MNTEISHFVLPSAPVKTLWFEFLFTEGLLESHLETKHCDPSPVELIIQFLSHAQSISPSTPPTPNPINGQESIENRDESNSNSIAESEAERKAFHLKLLALKVMSYLNWNLDIIESKLPLTMQLMLVEDLRRRCRCSPCETFSNVNYHRWLVRSLIKSTIPVRGYRAAIPNMPTIDPLFIPNDVYNNLTMRIHKEAEYSINQLNDLATSGEFAAKSSTLMVPTIASLKVKPLSTNSDGSKNYYDWSACREISSAQLLSEIRYELGKFYFIRDMNFIKSSQLFEMIPITDRSKFDHLEGYITAARDMVLGSNGGVDIADVETTDPITFFRACLADVLAGKCVDSRSIERKLSIEEISKEVNEYYKKCQSSDQRKVLSMFAGYLSCRIPGLRNLVLSTSNFKEDDESPSSPTHESMDTESVEAEMLKCTNEQMLIESTDPEVILDLSTRVAKEYYQLNSNFFVPRLLVSLTQAISSAPLSSKCLIVLAKANELRKAKLFIESRTLYLSVLEEVQALVPAFYDPLSYEILHNDLELNSSSNDIDERRTGELLLKCANVLRNEKTVQELSPELMELACLYLLDNSHPCLNDYSAYASNPLIRFVSLLHLTSKQATSVKYCKDFWEILTVALLDDPNDQNPIKKMKTLHPSLTGNSLNVSTLTSLITKIKSPALIAIVASALIRMHNLVKDSASLEISMIVLPVQLQWPAALATTSIMPPLEVIYTVITALISEVSSTQPIDVTWVKVSAELAQIRAEYKKSMKYFLEMLSILTGYFTTFTNSVEEEEAIKKMIIVCNKLNCHTSSAILQQMITTPNYALAFKSLGERSCFDSADHLYDCIWDVNLLEYLVNLHTKRGDMERKLKASQLIGQLELNANNSKEILSEAANVKKKTFFRILAKKYM